MALDIQATAKIRDRIHNLDVDELEEDRKIYHELRREYIHYNESRRKKAYNDGKGKTTVGLGFNMDRPEARVEWRNAFGVDCDGTERISFAEIYAGKRQLSNEEINILADYCLESREKELMNYYTAAWYKLKPNERLAVESAYYSGPEIVRGVLGEKPATNFYKNMMQYVQTSDFNFLCAAINELQYRSNPDRNKPNLGEGMQSRRDSEAEMLSSHKCPMYSKPHQPIVLNTAELNKRFRAEVGRTYIPRNNYDIQFRRYLDSGIKPKVSQWELVDSPYYIWRTVEDERVRVTHQANDGKVYRKDIPPSTGHPGTDYGCRCYAEKLPSHLEVVE